MNKPFQKLLLLVILLISISIHAQVRSTEVISFDLDKRTIGLLPFDERFKLSGFDTKYDKITLTYCINTNYTNKKPNYNKGGTIELVIDKLTGKAFPFSIEPLHPNVLYDFKFQVSKEIILSTKEEEALRTEIFEQIEFYFKKVKAINSGKITAFKINLQALLVKYAKTDKIYDRIGNLVDITTTPLYTGKLHDILTSIEWDYSEINSKYTELATNNEILQAEANAIKGIFLSNYYDPIFSCLAVALKDGSSISESFKSVLNSPINSLPGVNENLTLRQYLDYIIDDSETLLSQVIKGEAKINGNDHKKVEEHDLNSLRLISKIFEKLARTAIQKKNGDAFFTPDQKRSILYYKNRIDVIIEQLSNYKDRLQNIINAKTKIPNLLKNTIAKKDIKISKDIQIDAFAEKNAYIGLDAGVGYVFGTANGLFTYQGANFYFRPVNHRTPFGDLEGMDEFWKRFSLYLGVAQIITDKEKQYENLIGNNSVLIGAGYRLALGFRANIGGLLYYKKDSNPIVDNKKITISPTVSLSIDINLVKALGAVGSALNL